MSSVSVAAGTLRAACRFVRCGLCSRIAYTFLTLSTRRWTMSNHVYKQIELTGSSPTSSDDAVRCAIDKASKTLRNLHWFQVTETRGCIENDKVTHWQVTIKVGLRIED
jgi:flavin-binding protein dodecin